MGKSRHDRLVDRLGRILGDTHHYEGVDLKPRYMAVEVAVTESDIYQSISQLNRSRKQRKYLVVPREYRNLARKTLKGTGIGLMDGDGNILKRGRKKSK